MNESRSIDERALLLTLEESSRLVTHSHDPHETLENVVRLIRDRFHTAVCSVYLLEPDRGELVLAATVGLKSESVGRVRMKISEGLTGLVAEQVAPVMVEDAFKHPRFKYFPEAGEDPYHSFLGVPLLEGGALEGVLVVQTVEPRGFSQSEVRTLVTLAAQVAPLIGDARLLEQVVAEVHAPLPEARPEAETIQGVALSPGRGLGQVYVVDGFDEWRTLLPLTAEDPQTEKARLAEAMERARQEIIHLSHQISTLVGEDHGAILQAQLMIMTDRAIEKDLTACLEAGASAEGALFQTLDKYVAAFSRVNSPYFQERVFDVKDVFHRLLWELRPRRSAETTPEKLVLVAREASVMELFAVERDRIAGVVVEHGSPQSHAAILARSLGVPMVSQIAGLAGRVRPGQWLLVDGSAGTVEINPPQEHCLALSEAVAAPMAPAAEPSGGLPRVEVNVNLLYEVDAAVRLGASGVGLYRSEFLFLARRTLPTEEEQVGIYRKLLQQMNGRPVSIRTFDLRPDKLMAYAQMNPTAARPFDWRVVLDSPPLQQLFLAQVRAILRAGAPGEDGLRVGPVRLLIPLVTRTELLEFVLQTVTQAQSDLAHEGLPHATQATLGVMIETAAAAPLVEDWAEWVDFFALGTNDLTASALGLDRDDPVGSGLCDSLHPGLLRVIDGVVTTAHRFSRPVTVCGEMAASPEGCLALVALGVDSLSVPVNQLNAVRRRLSGLPGTALRELRPTLLRQKTSRQVRQILRAWDDSTPPPGKPNQG